MEKQKIIPHLWFNNDAKEAVEFYLDAFNDAKKLSEEVIENTPSGDCDIITFEISRHKFIAINAGPYFTKNPSISFMLNFDPTKITNPETQMDKLWTKLSTQGKILMPLQEYEFSKKYGWVEDKYGVSWQLILSDSTGDERPFIVPALLFTQEYAGSAEKAMNEYISVFKNTEKGIIARYPSNIPMEKEGTIMYADFKIENQWFACMDSGNKHEFKFNEAISLLIECETQEEIDYYWEKLSFAPEAEQCGWLKDKYGISWQVHAKIIEELMSKGTNEQKTKITKTFMEMKKLNIQKLKDAFESSQNKMSQEKN